MHEELRNYPSIVSVVIQWGDMDAFGHVNNTVPVRWFESSRINYLEKTGFDDSLKTTGIGPILAAVNCSYRRQLHYPDTVIVGCRVSRLGKSSMTLQHVVFSELLQEIAVSGESVVVLFDYEKQRPVRIPETTREAVMKLQPNVDLS